MNILEDCNLISSYLVNINIIFLRDGKASIFQKSLCRSTSVSVLERKLEQNLEQILERSSERILDRNL